MNDTAQAPIASQTRQPIVPSGGGGRRRESVQPFDGPDNHWLMPLRRGTNLLLMGTLLLFGTNAPGAVGGAASKPTAHLRVIVLPLENASDEPALDDWCHLFPIWVRSCLALAEFTEVASGELTGSAMTRMSVAGPKKISEKVAREIAEELSAQVAVWGSFGRTSNEWTVRLSVLRMDTNEMSHAVQDADTNWVTLSRNVALRLASGLGRKIPEDDLTRWNQRMNLSGPVLQHLAKAILMDVLKASPAEQEKALRQALAADPRCVVARQRLFPLLTKEEDLEEVVREALKLTPGDCETHAAAALVCLSKDDSPSAERELVEALRLHRGCPTAVRGFWFMHVPTGDWARLTNAIGPAHQARPDEDSITIFLAAALGQGGNGDAAYELLREIPDPIDTDFMMDLALLAAALTGERLDLAGRELTRLGPSAATNDLVRDSLATISLLDRAGISSNAPLTRPRVFNAAQLGSELDRRLSVEERVLLANPVEITPAIVAEARRLTVGLTNATAQALALFGEVARRGRGGGDGAQRTADASLRASEQRSTRLSCQEHAKLFVALARSLGLDAWLVHIERGADGLPVYHDCAALFLDGRGLLIDPAWSGFGIIHKEFTVLDDVQALAHQAMQPSKGPPNQNQLRAGLKLNPEDRWTQLQFVRGMAKAGEYKMADEQLRKVRAAGTDTWDVCEAAAELEMARGRWKPALLELQRAEVLSPSNAMVHALMADAYGELNDVAKSTEHMELAVALNRGELTSKFSREVSSQFAALKAFTQVKAGVPAEREKLQRMAEAGDATAQTALAKMYLEERPPRMEEALRWALKAAQQGTAHAQANYAKALLLAGGPGSAKESVVWFTRAAEQGYVEAQYSLGLILYDGNLVPRDNTTAAKWILLAGAKENAEAKALWKEMQLFLNPDELAEARKLADAFKPAKIE